MIVKQRHWTKSNGWDQQGSIDADLVFIFGETSALKEKGVFEEIRRAYPKSHLIGCSTAGEIQGARVFDDSVTTTAIKFANTKVESANLRLSSCKDSFEAGQKLAKLIPHDGLAHVIVFSVGLGVNGSELVKGLTSIFPPQTAVTGGLAGDKDRFHETLVISNGPPSGDMIGIIGLYGSRIKTGSASLGGWDPFGPQRKVTKSKANVLFELDGKSALDLYKSYLGEHAKDLPGSALLFPLSLQTPQGIPLVRTILAVNEADQSMTFAGDIPEGSYVQLMKANFDRLIEGAIGAAEKSLTGKEDAPELALLISCVGRKIVLKQRIEEEVEGVREIFGDQTVLTGFYSYGEISPFTPNAKCELHNQTMTITTLAETDDKAA
jgi:hypothetical protein